MPSKKISNQKDASCKQNLRVYRCVPEISKHSFAMPLTEQFPYCFVIHDYNRI